MKTRSAEIHRKTSETDVGIKINLDGSGRSKVSSGVPFFDHMLINFAKHGLFDLEVDCTGDLEIDAHHTVEDIGIGLGMAVKQSLGSKEGIVRFAHAYHPMDDALVRTAIDLSGRAYLVYNVAMSQPRIGTMDVELFEEFWKSFAANGLCNLHIELLYGRSTHHIIEAMFKSAARALCLASRQEPRIEGVPSTKGVL